MHHFLVVHFESDGIALCFHVSLNGLKMGAKIIGSRIPFKRKIQVFRITRQGVQKSQRCAAMKCECGHGAGTLQTLQDQSL